MLQIYTRYLHVTMISTVKLDANKTSSRRKMRKAHFGATSVERRKRMSSPLSKELFLRHHVRVIPRFKKLPISNEPYLNEFNFNEGSVNPSP